MEKKKSILACIIISGIIMATFGLNANAQSSEAIHPFHISIQESALTDLRQRVVATRWPEMETVSDQSATHRSRPGMNPCGKQRRFTDK